MKVDKNSSKKITGTEEKTSFLIPKINEIAMAVGIICFCPEDHYNIMYMNDFFVSELGYDDCAELQHQTGVSFLALIHPDELGNFKKYISGLPDEKDTFSCRFRCKNYEYKWFDVAAAYKTDADGKETVFCTCVNISKYKDLQTQMKDMHSEFEKVKLQMKAAIGNFPSGLLIFSLQDKKELCYISDNFCLMCGFTRNEIAQKYHNQYRNLVYDEDKGFFEKSLQELAEYPHQKNLEYRIKTKDGQVIWVLDSIKSIRDAKGDMWAYAVVIDISKWQKPWSVFNVIAENLPFGTVICDYHQDKKCFQIRFYNDYMKKYLDAFHDIQQIPLDKLKSIVVPEDFEKICDFLNTLNLEDAQADCKFKIQNGFSRSLICMKFRTLKTKEGILSIHAAFFDCCEQADRDDNFGLDNGYFEKFQYALPFAMMVKELGFGKEPFYVSPNMKDFFKDFIPQDDKQKKISYETAIHADDYKNLKRIYQQYQKELPSYFENEFRFIRKDGSILWIKENAKRLDGFSAPDMYLVVFTDITQLKNAEYKLRMREKENHIIAQKNNDIVGWFHIQNGTISFLDKNSAGYHIFEDHDKIIDFGGKIGYVQDESLKEYLGFYEKIKKYEPAEVEIKVKSPGDGEKWFFCTYDLIFEQDTSVVWVMIYFSDVSEKKLRELEIQKLKERERILEIISEDFKKVILKFHFQDKRYEPLNSIAKKLFKDIQVHTAENLISSRYVAEESIDVAKSFYEDMCKGKKTGTMNFKVKKLDGGYRWYQSTFTNVFIDMDIPAYAIIFCEDITEKRAHELAIFKIFRLYENWFQKDILKLRI